jgi:hypothetical protein
MLSPKQFVRPDFLFSLVVSKLYSPPSTLTMDKLSPSAGMKTADRLMPNARGFFVRAQPGEILYAYRRTSVRRDSFHLV